MIELRRQHYPSLGAALRKASSRPWKRPRWKTFSRSSSAHYVPTARFSAWRAGSSGSRCKDLVGRLLGDWAPGRRGRLRRSRPAEACTFPTTPTRHRSASPIPAFLIGIPTIFRRGAAVGVLSGGMSARLFTEVREKPRIVLQRLCLVSHALGSRRRFLLRRHQRPAGPGNAGSDPRRTGAFGPRRREPRTGPPQGAHQERACHAAGIEFRRAVRRWPAIGIIWAAPARLDEMARHIDALTCSSINHIWPSTRRRTSPL